MTINRQDIAEIWKAKTTLAHLHVEPDGAPVARLCLPACTCPGARAWMALHDVLEAIDMEKVAP